MLISYKNGSGYFCGHTALPLCRTEIIGVMVVSGGGSWEGDQCNL